MSVPADRHSRRNLLRFVGAGSAGVLLAGPSMLHALQPAATAPAGRGEEEMQGAGFFTFPLGDVKVSVVSDGGFVMKPAEVFPDVPKGALEDAAKAAHVSLDGYPGQINTLLVRRGSDVILIDTGSGRNFGPTAGKLLGNLARIGVRPSDVTHVVLSHAHPDHIGGLLTPEGTPAFGRATVYVNRAEHDFWTSADPSLAGMRVPDEMKSMVIGIAKKSLAGVKGSLELVKPGDTVAGVVTIVDAAGHTPGHVALRVGRAEGQRLLFLGDALFIPPLQLQNLDWHALYDTDPTMAAVARRSLLELAAKEEMLATPAHAPFPAVGYFDTEGAGFRWTPRPWTWNND